MEGKVYGSFKVGVLREDRVYLSELAGRVELDPDHNGFRQVSQRPQDVEDDEDPHADKGVFHISEIVCPNFHNPGGDVQLPVVKYTPLFLESMLAEEYEEKQAGNEQGNGIYRKIISFWTKK